MPHQHSKSGPGISVADVNGDGLEDFYVGTGAGSKSGLFIQQTNGKFISKSIDNQNFSDEMGALFFDADQDGDQDLYIASGGVLAQETPKNAYQHRLFLNDGKGNFTKTKNLIPNITTSASCVTAADFDKDGDLDLFIGGRVSPNEYPTIPRSYLLRNDRGKFKDISTESLAKIGMVSSALWTDTNNDGFHDLMIVGEYIPITIFENKQGKLNKEPVIISESSGWWNSLVGGDFDQDGDTDYLMGNLGLNTQHKASVKYPTCVYGKDFDKNGVIDPIICHFVEGEEQIFHTRDDFKQANDRHESKV